MNLNSIRTKMNKEQAKNTHAKIDGAAKDLETYVANTLATMGGKVTALHYTHDSGCDLRWELEIDGKTTESFLDIKMCRASNYGGSIFLERSSWNKEANHFAKPAKGKHLLYVDIGNGKCYLISTMKLKNSFADNKNTTRGGDSARGYVLSIADDRLDAQLLCVLK